jgi:hypothetical protein
MWDELFDELYERFNFSSIPSSVSTVVKKWTSKTSAKPIRSNPKTLALESVKDLMLVSQEDIFRPGRRKAPILLLSKGQEISAKDLPKLILHGVQPEQFRFKTEATAQALLAEEDSTMDAGQTMTELLTKTEPSTVRPWRSPGERRNQTVVILEPDSKTLKRIIDCLFVCGFDLNRIHPVRMAANLNWTLRRYEPDLVITDAELLADGLSSESHTLFPTQLIITFAGPIPLKDAITEVRLTHGAIAQCLYKPITRFSLRQILAQTEQQPLSASAIGPQTALSQKLPVGSSTPRRAILRMG